MAAAGRARRLGEVSAVLGGVEDARGGGVGGPSTLHVQSGVCSESALALPLSGSGAVSHSESAAPHS